MKGSDAGNRSKDNLLALTLSLHLLPLTDPFPDGLGVHLRLSNGRVCGGDVSWVHQESRVGSAPRHGIRKGEGKGGREKLRQTRRRRMRVPFCSQWWYARIAVLGALHISDGRPSASEAVAHTRDRFAFVDAQVFTAQVSCAWNSVNYLLL